MTQRKPSSAGFTLLEVMIGLALLGLALVVLIKSAAGSIFNSEQAHMLGVVTDLGRGKMYDIEEILLKDGFTDTNQSQEDDKCLVDEGWPTVCYSYKVEEPKLPSLDQLQQMSQDQAKSKLGSAMGSGGSAAGSDALGGFENSALGGMLGMFGGGKQDITAAQGGSLIASQYSMFQDILKVSVRKVTLTMKWKVLGADRDLKIVAFFTDAAAMDKVLSGMGSQEFQDTPAGAGSGSGSGSGTKTTPGSGPGAGSGSGPGAGKGSGK